MKHTYNPEGFRNPNDIHDQPTFNDIENEIAQERLDRRIRFHFDTTTLGSESKKLLEQWRAEMQVCLEEWSVGIINLISQDEKISPRIREYLEIEGMDLPTFDLYEKKEADEALQKFGFNREKIETGNFLVVFNLPKPLSQFWWKGDAESWDSKSKDVRTMVIEWGRIYRLIIPIIWNAVDNSPSTMERINPCGMHDPKQYYYLWEIGVEPTHRYDDPDEYQDNNSVDAARDELV
jgi:hypothetical protein